MINSKNINKKSTTNLIFYSILFIVVLLSVMYFIGAQATAVQI
jgi:hypothetical protein